MLGAAGLATTTGSSRAPRSTQVRDDETTDQTVVVQPGRRTTDHRDATTGTHNVARRTADPRPPGRARRENGRRGDDAECETPSAEDANRRRQRIMATTTTAPAASAVHDSTRAAAATMAETTTVAARRLSRSAEIAISVKTDWNQCCGRVRQAVLERVTQQFVASERITHTVFHARSGLRRAHLTRTKPPVSCCSVRTRTRSAASTRAVLLGAGRSHLPPSLVNIYTELRTIWAETPKHGNLESGTPGC